MRALCGVNLNIKRGEVLAIMGPSGSGKSTLMNMLGCLDRPTSGEYRLDGEVVSHLNDDQLAEIRNRKVGFVFQTFNLLPRMTALGNVELPLRYSGGNGRRREKAEQALKSVGLGDRMQHKPMELSGGQQQRVALARAIAPQPRLLLLDEPFSNLDVVLREKLALEVREILKNEAITGLLVTHDQFEAFAIADVVGVMTDGVIQQWDTPYNLYHEPHTRFIADFIGQGVFLPGKVLSGDQIAIELGNLAAGKASEYEAGAQTLFHTGDTVEVLIRPDDIVHDDDSLMVAEVARKAFRGAEFIYTLRLPSGAQVLALVPSHHNHAVGEKIGIRLEVDHVVAYRR